MTYSKTKVELIINEDNKNWFKIYQHDGFNFIYPSENDELSNYWEYLIGYYYYNKNYNEFIMYNPPVFKTFPENGIEMNEINRPIVTDKLRFEFQDEETAFYFKLKFC